jgi:GNAT superfamily N-acetyltransferase
MDIRRLDDAVVADDAVMREFYDINRRAELLGREQSPFWTFGEFLASMRAADSGERQDLFAAYDGDRMVATATLWSFLLDNTDKAFFALDVDVTARRRGIGRAMLERLEQLAKDDHRELLLTDTKLPFAERESHGYRRFAEACGYSLSNYEVVRHLPLPVPDDAVQAWVDEAAPHHEGYSIETYVDEVPDELLESLCQLLGQLAVDAPTGEVDFEQEIVTPQRFAEMLAAVRAMDRIRLETVAVTPDRQVVAQHRRLPVGHDGPPRPPRPPAGPRDQGGQPPGRPGLPRRPHPDHHAERRDQRLHGLDQREDRVPPGRGRRRAGQAVLVS